MNLKDPNDLKIMISLGTFWHAFSVNACKIKAYKEVLFLEISVNLHAGLNIRKNL